MNTFGSIQLGQEVFGSFVDRTDRRNLHVQIVVPVGLDISLGILRCKPFSTPSKVGDAIPTASRLIMDTVHQDDTIRVVSIRTRKVANLLHNSGIRFNLDR